MLVLQPRAGCILFVEKEHGMHKHGQCNGGHRATTTYSLASTASDHWIVVRVGGEESRSRYCSL